MSNARAKAASKILVGAGQFVSGAMTATGHGIVGTVCRNSGMMSSARVIGRRSCQDGKKNLTEGMNEWRQANRP